MSLERCFIKAVEFTGILEDINAESAVLSRAERDERFREIMGREHLERLKRELPSDLKELKKALEESAECMERGRFERVRDLVEELGELISQGNYLDIGPKVSQIYRELSV